MKHWRLLDWYGSAICLIMALIVVHAPLIVSLETVFPREALVIKAWKELIMIGLIAPAVWMMWRTNRHERWTNDRLFWLVVAYLVVALASLAQWNGVQSVLAGLSIDLRFVAFFALTYVVVRLRPAYRGKLLRIATIGALVVIGFAVVQFFLPHDFLKILGYSNDTIAPYGTIDRNHEFVRQISTLRGPNPLGAYAMAVLMVVAAFVGRKRYKRLTEYWQVGVFGIGGLAALYVSFSRSAYLGFAIGLLVVCCVRWGRAKRFWYLLGAAASAAIAVVAVIMAIQPSYIANVIFHTNPEHVSAVNSNTEHADSLITGSQLLSQHPFGAGIGSAGSASLLGTSPVTIENQYLQIAYETGWLGLAVFVALYVIVLIRLWRRRDDPWTLGIFAAGIGLGVIGFLLPVWVDDTVSIVWWGLAAVLIADRKGVQNGERST